MKKVLFTFALLLFFASSGLAQVFGSKMHEVSKMYLPATGMQIGFYCDAYRPKLIYYDLKSSSSDQEVQARIHVAEFTEFISRLKKAKKKYEEWSKVAEKEGTRLFSKRIPILIYGQTMYFTDEGNWYGESGVDINLMFYVNEEGDCQFVIQTDRMTSDEVVAHSSSLGLGGFSSNVSVEHECSGASLTFQSSKEIDEFIEKLQSVMDIIKDQKSQKKKFK